MYKILIYGAGDGGDKLLTEMRKNSEPYELQAFIDMRTGGTEKHGVPVIFPKEIGDFAYDFIFVATLDQTVPKMLQEKYGVLPEKINYTRYLNSVEISVRVRALERFKEICDTYGLTGSVSEVGVYQGDFAKEINRLFPESKLYLYDTFDGFDSADIALEENGETISKYVHYANTSIDLVMSKLPHPEKAIIRKGFFPETAVGADEKYLFVNLDADLYAPILAGLEYFWPRLVPGGGIFVHDYFAPDFTGPQKAVSEFINRFKVAISPIGDFKTVSITKPF